MILFILLKFIFCFLISSESEDSDDELDLETIHDNLMRKTSLEEGILFELERENQLRVKVGFFQLKFM